MFGVLRPCRNRLGVALHATWTAHLCGLCLALRDEHGHTARVVTNYDALIVSALVEAQQASPARRAAGPCALRGMRRASVATGDGARLAASVSLLLASARLGDHLADDELAGALRTGAARRVATRWASAGTDTGRALGFDTAVLSEVVARQIAVETTGTTLLEITTPTEDATAAAFRHTAILAARPGNADVLAEAGRLFGRLAHLIDAVEDLHADRNAGAWNPVVATGLAPAEVRQHCDDALLGIRLTLREATFADDRLVHTLLVHELAASVERAFATAGQPRPPAPPGDTPPPRDAPPAGDALPAGWEAPPPPARRRNPVVGCLGWLLVCGTCQACCADEYTDPCTGQRRKGLCPDGSCCEACSCCDGCDGCDCCDCGC